jgi:hypothetical protein
MRRKSPSEDYTSATGQKQADQTFELRETAKTVTARRDSGSEAILTKDLDDPPSGIWKTVKVGVDSQKSGASEENLDGERRNDW